MCDIYREPYECVSFADKKILHAQKRHECNECRDGIPQGSTYYKVSGLVGGDFFQQKVCARCYAGMQWLLQRGHGWEGGTVLADVRYCVEEELREKGRVYPKSGKKRGT